MKNVYEMICEWEAGLDESRELFVRRDSWNDGNAFQVIGTRPDWKEWQGEPPPYFGGKVIVYGVVRWATSRRYEAHALSGPGTYAYSRIERPGWWRPPERWVRLALQGGGSVEFCLTAGHE